MTIPVSLSSDCDPRRARAVLLKVAQDNPHVLAMPAPSAVLEDFGDNFLFKLHVYCDTDRDVQTDLRLAILDALHAAGLRKLAHLSTEKASNLLAGEAAWSAASATIDKIA
jgi:small-conductance mechanosensitive channel